MSCNLKVLTVEEYEFNFIMAIFEFLDVWEGCLPVSFEFELADRVTLPSSDGAANEISSPE